MNALMQRIAAGPAGTCCQFLSCAGTPIRCLTFIHRMSGDHHRSEELFQDVFVANLVLFPQIPIPATPFSFLALWDRGEEVPSRSRRGRPTALASLDQKWPRLPSWDAKVRPG